MVRIYIALKIVLFDLHNTNGGGYGRETAKNGLLFGKYTAVNLP